MQPELMEKKTHGTPSFPFEIYRAEQGAGRIFAPCHWHSEIEILYFLKGNADVSIAGKDYRVSDKCIFFVNKEELHQIESSGDGLFYYAFVFPAEFLSSGLNDGVQNTFISPLIQKEILLPTQIEGNNPVFNETAAQIDDMLISCKNKVYGYHLSVKAALLKIIAVLAKEGLFFRGTDTNPVSRDKMRREVLEYLDLHYSERLYLGDIAAHFGMSPKYFCRYFKNSFGRTLMEYLHHFRIKQASALLLGTDMRIMDIAFAVGFDNFSYFIRKFKELTGMTPSEYRKSSGDLYLQTHVKYK